MLSYLIVCFVELEHIMISESNLEENENCLGEFI